MRLPSRVPVAAAAVICCSVAFCQTSVARAGLLAHQGRWLIDQQGRVVILHGLGVMDYSPPSLPAAVGFDDDDAAFLAAHGFNYVRVGMNWSGIEPAPGVFASSYLSSIRQTVRTLAAHRIYSLLDWHQDDWGTAAAGIDGAPAWATETDGLPNPTSQFGAGYVIDSGQQRAFDNFWNNAPGPGRVGLQDRYTAMLARYGRAFRGEPYLLGYELFNEPFPGTTWSSCANPSGCPVFDAQLSAFYRRVIPALRAADPSHLIFYEPNLFFDFGSNTNLDNAAGGDRRTGFAFHDYCLASGAGTALPPAPGGGGAGCATEEQTVISDALDYASKTGAALINSEWGATSDPIVIARMADELDHAMVGWLYWDYNSSDFVADPRKPPGGKNVNQRILKLLERPYPQAVAGTPLAWNWDPASRTFSLRYTTVPPPSARLARGALTEVWVGRWRYRVRASGANVVSHRSAKLLVLRARPGASNVSVVVTPA